jgi:hypothetical protein
VGLLYGTSSFLAHRGGGERAREDQSCARDGFSRLSRSKGRIRRLHFRMRCVGLSCLGQYACRNPGENAAARLFNNAELAGGAPMYRPCITRSYCQYRRS